MCRYRYDEICKRYIFNILVEKLSNRYSINENVKQIIEEHVNRHFSLSKELREVIEEVYQSVINKLNRGN